MSDSTPLQTAVYSVPDISCDHCVNAITNEVTRVVGVSAVNVDLDAKNVTVVGGDPAAVIAAIDEAGFDIAS